jgi:hypothetical protein
MLEMEAGCLTIAGVFGESSDPERVASCLEPHFSALLTTPSCSSGTGDIFMPSHARVRALARAWLLQIFVDHVIQHRFAPFLCYDPCNLQASSIAFCVSGQEPSEASNQNASRHEGHRNSEADSVMGSVFALEKVGSDSSTHLTVTVNESN